MVLNLNDAHYSNYSMKVDLQPRCNNCKEISIHQHEEIHNLKLQPPTEEQAPTDSFIDIPWWYVLAHKFVRAEDGHMPAATPKQWCSPWFDKTPVFHLETTQDRPQFLNLYTYHILSWKDCIYNVLVSIKRHLNWCAGCLQNSRWNFQ